MITDDDISKRRANLSPAQQALLEKRLRGKSQQVVIPRRPEQEPMALSFAQQRLWFLDQLIPGSPTYNIPIAVRLSGQLNIEVLQQSLSEIVRRHEVLRTTFPSLDGQPSLEIMPALSLPLPVIDLQHYPESEQEERALQLVAQEAQQPFDLAQGPLLRTMLLRLSDIEHIFLVTMHHITSDGWSAGIFIHEMTILYSAFSAGKPSPLPELPLQYTDFAHWQRGWLQGERLEKQLAYWREQLSENPPTLELLGDRPRPAIQTFQGGSQSFQVSASVSQALKTLSQQEGVTLFMTLLAAFKTLLYRYTGQSDILVGTPIASRSRVELERLIGFFANTLVLRTNLSGDLRFRALLQRVRTVTSDAYAHQDLPFEKLVEEVQPGRDTSRNPLFQVMFVLQNAPLPLVEHPELTFSPVEAYSGTAKFDLWMGLIEEGDSLRGSVEYSTDIFDADTITRMLGHFQILLEGISANPDQQLANLPLITPTDQQLLATWNNTTTHYPQVHCLHHLVETQAMHTPAAPALFFEDQCLTYQELNERANQLAHHLRALGLRPETLVGIFVERSLEMVIGLLGIIKAGGAYVPLDPSYPHDRLAFMIADAQLPLLLTQAHLLDQLPAHTAQVVCLDRDWDIIGRQDGTNPVNWVTPDHLAYMIYTSGSTGKPKGAMNSHRGICNRLLWMQETYQLTSADRVLQKTPFSFDVSVWEFFWPLLTGASIVLARPEGHKDSAYLVNLIVERGITTLHFVPSMLQVFLEEPELGTCQSLKRVICSGEALPFVYQERFFARLSAELHNLYGPTEAAVDVTFWACDRTSTRRTVPIGYPVANTQIYILDPYLNPVPIGVPGELHIGGVQLARGYLNRADLTAERFIPNPLSSSQGERLYKTGDLARYMVDGSLEFLGRLDYQVKVRGFRIELGEVEATLQQHPNVQDAVVLYRDSEHSPDTKQFVAYVMLQSQEQNDTAQQPAGAVSSEQVWEWQQVFDQTYTQSAAPAEPTFNIVGWNSSYTDAPLAAEEMREWVDQTVDRILALQPRRVMEIGCGTGLLLFRIAPECAQYYGTDFSQTALSYLHHQLMQASRELPQVTLAQRTADDFSGVSAGWFDTLVLNSVVQYFPSIDYLLQVLERAVDAVAPGGHIFLGDIRNRCLLETFHSSVELFRAPPTLSTTRLQQRIQKRISQEQELVIDPVFFLALKRHLPKINRVDIHLRRGHSHNELTRFRYDVTLHIDTQPAPAHEVTWLSWDQDGLTTASVKQLIDDQAPQVLGIKGVPNARLVSEMQLLALLAQPELPETVADVRRVLAQNEEKPGVDPETLWALENEIPYKVDITWSDKGSLYYDVIFRRRSSAGHEPVVIEPVVAEAVLENRDWHSYANNPLQEKLARKWAPTLRAYLKEQLPEYMIPSTFMLVDAWPLTPNGKLDRQALPLPPQIIPGLEKDFVAPDTVAEKILAGLWAEVLNLEQVGIHDNFFELGGDSLHTIRVVARANQAGLHITSRQLFQYQTIAELAVVAELVPTTPAGSESAASGYLADTNGRTAFPLSGLEQPQIDHLQALISDIDDIYPLSPYQEHMLSYTLHKTPEAGSFIWQRIVVMPLQLDPVILEQTLRQIVARFPALRTSFIWQDLQSPLQIVHTGGAVAVVEQDWRGLAAEVQEAQLEAYLRADRAAGFALNESAGMRLFFARINENFYQVIVTSSYLRLDGWSAELVFDEIFRSYGALLANQSLPQTGETLYRDYIAWQQRQDLAEAQSFWQETLKDFTAPTPLISRAPQNIQGQGHGFARGHMYLSASTTTSLRALAKQHRLTLNTLFQSAWALLLSHYCDQEEVTFGVTVTGRTPTLPRVESIVGCVFNTLPFRIRVPRETSLESWFKEVMMQQVKVTQYEHTPLAKIYEWAALSEDMSLFQSDLVFQNLWKTPSNMAHTFYAQMEHPLRVDVFPQPEIAVVMCYYEQWFTASTIARLLEDLKSVLEGFVAHPEQRIGDVMRLLQAP
jgi:amino acid adenylation domain-containing protein